MGTKIEDLKPLAFPKAPVITGMPYGLAKETLENYIQDMQYVVDENSRRFRKAMVKVRLCAFLRGFQTAFQGSNAGLDDSQHYSWCPYPYWMHKASFCDRM